MIAGQLRERKPGETPTSGRLAVARSFNQVRGPAVRSGRRLPFYWWAGVEGSATRYAMKPQVAQLFRAARHQSTYYL